MDLTTIHIIYFSDQHSFQLTILFSLQTLEMIIQTLIQLRIDTRLFLVLITISFLTLIVQ